MDLYRCNFVFEEKIHAYWALKFTIRSGESCCNCIHIWYGFWNKKRSVKTIVLMYSFLLFYYYLWKIVSLSKFSLRKLEKYLRSSLL